MKYYYDILLNFYEYPINYYEWNNSDNIEIYKKLRIYRVDNISDFVKYHMSIDLDDNVFIISDGINALAIELIEGNVAYLSFLSYEDENMINGIAINMELSNLKIKKKKKRIIPFELREDIKYKRYLLSKVKSSNEDFIRYIYFDIFNREDRNIEEMRMSLIYDINNNFNDKYVNLYQKLSK